MYNFTAISTRKALTDPWPEDVYTSIEDHSANVIEDYTTVTGSISGVNVDISEDGLEKTITWSFANETDFNTWKGLIMARSTYSAMVSTIDSFVAETDDRYKYVDNVWYSESDFPNW